MRDREGRLWITLNQRVTEDPLTMNECGIYRTSSFDVDGNPITEVDPADLASVGAPDNTVVGRYPDPADPSGQKLLAGSAGLLADFVDSRPAVTRTSVVPAACG